MVQVLQPPLNLLGTVRAGAVADVGTSTLALARPLAAGGGGGEEGEEEGAAAAEESGPSPPPELAPFEALRPALVGGRWRQGECEVSAGGARRLGSTGWAALPRSAR